MKLLVNTLILFNCCRGLRGLVGVDATAYYRSVHHVLIDDCFFKTYR